MNAWWDSTDDSESISLGKQCVAVRPMLSLFFFRFTVTIHGCSLEMVGQGVNLRANLNKRQKIGKFKKMDFL